MVSSTLSFRFQLDRERGLLKDEPKKSTFRAAQRLRTDGPSLRAELLYDPVRGKMGFVTACSTLEPVALLCAAGHLSQGLKSRATSCCCCCSKRANPSFSAPALFPNQPKGRIGPTDHGERRTGAAGWHSSAVHSTALSGHTLRSHHAPLSLHNSHAHSST